MRQEQTAMTIKDVAREAGVSTMTVSRAFRPGAIVSEATKKKVFDTAQRLGYRPNVNARALRGGNSMSIGMLVSNPVSHIFVRGLSEQLMNKGYVSYVVDSLGDPDIIMSSLRDFINRNVDGVIIGWRDYFLEHSEIKELLGQVNNPVFFAREQIDDVPYDLCQLSFDDAYLSVVKHWVALGRQRIVFLGREDSFIYGSIKRALAANGCDCDDWHWDTSGYASKPFSENYLDALRDKLSAGIVPDAILTNTDLTVAKIVAMLNEHGLKTPDDVAIVGNGNAPLGAFCAPALASIDVPGKEIGECVFEFLMNRLKEPESKLQKALFSAEFINRKSAG